jgi:hypothetical protein
LARLHFLVRLLGITGLVVGGVGLFLAVVKNIFTLEHVQSAALGLREQIIPDVALAMLLGGGLLAVIWLVIEIAVGVRVLAGRRGALGFNIAVQAALAVVLVVGVNLYSFQHYLRFDWTGDQRFTLPESLRQQLSQLKGETTIVVYQQHKTFASLSGKADAYDKAAQRKVTEKVKDLVEEFREFGPQFRVVVLDVEEDGYKTKLKELTRDAPELQAAINAAPENSLFFHTAGKVQRLSFNEFYLLDKSKSQQEGNLVLLNQGAEPFARKVLNIDAKRPKVAVLTIHEWLTTAGPEEFGLAGLKKTLTSRGFDVRDVILKKWSEMGPPEAAVYSYDESKFQRLEEQLAELNDDIKVLEREMPLVKQAQQEWQKASLQDLTKKYAKRMDVDEVTEPLRKLQLRFLEQQLAVREQALKQTQEERDTAAKEKSALSIDSSAEMRRMTDLKAKLDRALADCDLVIIPRMTLRNVNIGDRIPNRVYRLEDAQVNAIKDYLKKSGKRSVLVCFGPTNEPADSRPDLDSGGSDGLEDLMAQLGVRLSKQTVLFNAESKSFAERRSGLLISGVNVEVPTVHFDDKLELGPPVVKPAEGDTAPEPNPIRRSMQIAAHSLGKELDLRLRHPRPVYCDPAKRRQLPYAPEFMLTSAASWNDDQPFPTRERTPRYDPKPDDPAKGTLDEKRTGPFPIGVAFETTLPADWYDDRGTTHGTVRVAAIGHGGVFVGTELSPAKEQLLLNTCNWLLGRDDLLPRNEPTWKYPRITLTAETSPLWVWGPWIGLPLLAAYCGVIVLMVRRMR